MDEIEDVEKSKEELLDKIDKLGGYLELLQNEIKRKQKITDSVYNKIKSNSLRFLLNSNLSKEDKELFKDIFKEFLSDLQ